MGFRLVSVALMVAFVWTSHVGAQVTRLPPTATIPNPISPYEGEAFNERPRDLLAGYPRELSQPLIPEGQPSAGPELPGGTLGGAPFQPGGPLLSPDGTLPPVTPVPESTLPKGAKNGVFQQALVATTYMPRFGGANGFGITDVLAQVTLGFPFFTRENPLVVIPSFQVQMLDGPTAPSLPPEIYDASIEFMHIRKFTDTFSLIVGATPGAHGDFEQSNSETLRVPAKLLGMWQWNPKAQWILGVLYLARDDVNFLPAGGVIWTPNEETRLELIFPRPRYAHRFAYAGNIEWWWYAAGEFGGGSYTVRDAGGFGSNVMTLKDLRAILGLERRVTGGINSRIEVGYVFSRSIMFHDTLPTFEPDPTLLVRGGLSY